MGGQRGDVSLRHVGQSVPESDFWIFGRGDVTTLHWRMRAPRLYWASPKPDLTDRESRLSQYSRNAALQDRLPRDECPDHTALLGADVYGVEQQLTYIEHDAGTLVLTA